MTTLYSAAKAMLDVLNILKETGISNDYIGQLLDFKQFAKIVNIKEIREMEEDYLPKKRIKEKYEGKDYIVK